MKKKKGISLIVLIVTIIVIIILATVVILTLTKNNPIDSAKEATIKSDFANIQDELSMYISKQYASSNGNFDQSTLSLYGDDMVKALPSSKKYVNEIEIKSGKLAWSGENGTDEEKYFYDVLKDNVSVSSTTLAEKAKVGDYVDYKGGTSDGKWPLNSGEWNYTLANQSSSSYTGWKKGDLLSNSVSGKTNGWRIWQIEDVNNDDSSKKYSDDVVYLISSGCVANCYRDAVYVGFNYEFLGMEFAQSFFLDSNVASQVSVPMGYYDLSKSMRSHHDSAMNAERQYYGWEALYEYCNSNNLLTSDLFAIGSVYWIDVFCGDNDLWRVNADGTINSNSTTNGYNYGVRILVKLKPGIKTTSQGTAMYTQNTDSNIKYWNLSN